MIWSQLFKRNTAATTEETRSLLPHYYSHEREQDEQSNHAFVRPYSSHDSTLHKIQKLKQKNNKEQPPQDNDNVGHINDNPDDDDRRAGSSMNIKAATNATGPSATALKKNIMYFFTLLLTALCCITSFRFVFPKPLTSRTAFSYENINSIISFGDSYTTRYLDMDSLTYACRNCTSAGGPNWVIYLTDSTQWISWDFAYNSAPVNNSIVNQIPTVIDVNTQIHDLYQKLFVSPTEKVSSILMDVYKDKKRTSASTLVTIWVGINDIRLTYNWKDTDTLDSTIMTKYAGLIEELMQEGERQFMIMNVPPLHRAPLWHNTVDEHVIRERVKEFNKKLTSMINHLRKNHSDSYLIEYNAWTFFTDMLDQPEEHGLTDIDTYCPDWSHPIDRGCKPIEEYFWLNDLHPTYHVHEHLAKNIDQYLRDLEPEAEG